MKKPVLQYDKNGNFLAEYESVKQAAIESGIIACNISRRLNGKQLNPYKYIWKYKEFDKVIDYKFIKKMFKDIILDRYGNETKGLNYMSRKRDYSDLRMVFYKLCKIHAHKFSLASCGEFLGQDHTTVLSSINKFDYVLKDKSFIYKDLYNKIDTKIKKLKVRHRNEIPTQRQNIYTMNKKNLITEILWQDKEIIKLKSEIETLKASDIEVEYKLIAS